MWCLTRRIESTKPGLADKSARWDKVCWKENAWRSSLPLSIDARDGATPDDPPGVTVSLSRGSPRFGRGRDGCPARVSASWARREATEGRTSVLESPGVSGGAVAGGGGSGETAMVCCQAWDDLSLSNSAFTPSVFWRKSVREWLPSARRTYVHVGVRDKLRARCDQERLGWDWWPR